MLRFAYMYIWLKFIIFSVSIKKLFDKNNWYMSVFTMCVDLDSDFQTPITAMEQDEVCV